MSITPSGVVRLLLSCVISLCSFLLPVQTLMAQTAHAGHGNTSTSDRSGHERSLSLVEISTKADVIVVGTVGSLSSTWNENKSSIQTVVTISVDESLKGDLTGNEIAVTVPGGEIDGAGEWYSHSTRFSKDESVVVFASKDAKGKLRIAPGAKGKFLIVKDEQSGKRLVGNIGLLEDFTSEVRHILTSESKEQK